MSFFAIGVQVPEATLVRGGAPDASLKSWAIATIITNGRPNAALWWTDDVARTRSAKAVEGGAYALALTSRPAELNDDVLTMLVNSTLVVRVYKGETLNAASDVALGWVCARRLRPLSCAHACLPPGVAATGGSCAR